MARCCDIGSTGPTNDLFLKQPFAHYSIASVPTSPSLGGLSDPSTSPRSTSLLTLLRNLPAPSDAKTPSSSPPAPILRRDSIGSDDHARRELTFTVAPQPSHSHSHAQPHLAPSADAPFDSDSDGDQGYEEDSEDGEFSDDEDYAAAIPQPPSPSEYPFARPTNYGRHSELYSPAPAVLPPPPRRGRGHIRVVDTKQPSKACSRHCSPPPVRSRSGSEAKSRTSDAGPREGRCGSPMPDVSDLPDVEDEEEEKAPRWRRASEHLQGFRQYGQEDERLSPAAVDPTPILGSSLRRESDIYHRLETSLTTSTNLDRAKSLGTRVSFAPRRRPTSAISADERAITRTAQRNVSEPIACPRPPRRHE